MTKTKMIGGACAAAIVAMIFGMFLGPLVLELMGWGLFLYIVGCGVFTFILSILWDVLT